LALTYDPIATATASGSTAGITFSSISGNYTDLILVVSATPASSNVYLGYIKINGDTGTNYSETLLYGTGTTAGSARESNRTAGYIGNWTTVSTTTSPTVYTVNFMNYSNTTTFKTILSRAADAGKETNAVVNLWRSTSAITSIEFYVNVGNLTSGSTATLYGVKASA